MVASLEDGQFPAHKLSIVEAAAAQIDTEKMGAAEGHRDSTECQLLENEFIVYVEKCDAANEVGLSLSLIDGLGLLVHQVKEGIVQEWNGQHPGNLVKRHTCIVEVNGARNRPTEMLEAIKRDMVLTMVMRRCRAIYVDIPRNDNSRELGLVFDYRPGNATLLVNQVSGGLIGMWNQVHSSDAVREGDRIVVVNGICGSAFLMLGVVKGKDALKMCVIRI